MNPLTDEMIEYLEENCFTQVSEGRFSNLYSTIDIRDETVSFLEFHDEEEGQRKAEYKEIMSFTGLSYLSIDQFKQLLELTGFIHQNQFI